MKKATSKKMTIDDLAIMVAKGFDGIDKKFSDKFSKVEKYIAEVKKDITGVKNDIAEVKENLASTRMDVLGIGDRFVSKHEFSQHLIRFSLLEQKVKAKKQRDKRVPDPVSRFPANEPLVRIVKRYYGEDIEDLTFGELVKGIESLQRDFETKDSAIHITQSELWKRSRGEGGEQPRYVQQGFSVAIAKYGLNHY